MFSFVLISDIGYLKKNICLAYTDNIYIQKCDAKNAEKWKSEE